jgi:hypothetical protein
VVSGIISIYFRIIELKKEVILMPKQLGLQILLFIVFAIIFWKYFSEVYIDLWFIKLWWIIIYLTFSSASFYAMQVFYEYFSGNELFATEAEMKKYIEKIERDKF